MEQSQRNGANSVLPSQNVNIDANTATTSDLAENRPSRKRTASSDNSINQTQSKEHEQNGLNIDVANADGVPSKKTRKVEVTQSRSIEYSNKSGNMNMTMCCRHDVVTSTPKAKPYALPFYSVNHAITTQLSPIQKPLSGFPHNSFTNFVKVAEDIQQLVLRYVDEAQEKITNSVQILEQSLCDAEGRNGSVPVVENVIVISDSNNRDIEIIPGPSARTNIEKEATNNNQKEQVPTSSIHLQNCPICLEALDNNPISCTICGHIFCTPCITNIVKSKKECPTCRTRLTNNKIHPLFI